MMRLYGKPSHSWEAESNTDLTVREKWRRLGPD
jgi:hypothetical protein